MIGMVLELGLSATPIEGPVAPPKATSGIIQPELSRLGARNLKGLFQSQVPTMLAWDGPSLLATRDEGVTQPSVVCPMAIIRADPTIDSRGVRLLEEEVDKAMVRSGPCAK